MTKAEEKQLLRETIEKFGPDSYIGPALADATVYIESCIDSDLPIYLSSYLKEVENRISESKKSLEQHKKEIASTLSELREIKVRCLEATRVYAETRKQCQGLAARLSIIF